MPPDERYYSDWHQLKIGPGFQRETTCEPWYSGKLAAADTKDRDSGKVTAHVVDGFNSETMRGFVVEYTPDGAAVYTGPPFDHEAVKHSVGENLRDQAHTNGIESFCFAEEVIIVETNRWSEFASIQSVKAGGASLGASAPTERMFVSSKYTSIPKVTSLQVESDLWAGCLRQ